MNNIYVYASQNIPRQAELSRYIILQYKWIGLTKGVTNFSDVDKDIVHRIIFEITIKGNSQCNNLSLIHI